MDDEDQSLNVHRASLLSELLKPVPKEFLHTNKKLVKIEEAEEGGVFLHFLDGTKENADAIIGADGIHGYVREYILGHESPALKPTFAGFWDCRMLVPIEKARKVLGEQYFDKNRQYCWIGDGGFFLHDVLDNGKTLQVVASRITDESWNPSEWKRDLDRKTLEEAFSGWTNSPIANSMIEVSSVFI
jgi:salicylate hydroxylase